MGAAIRPFMAATHPPNTTATAIERYREGWRTGKPVEDPEKLKRWGWVGAKPSEYLVTTRNGVVDRKRSGQGARVIKWPWHAIAIVPTTLQRIEFTADQITRERVGVEVSGIAVYRIAEPLLAFRVLNFTFPEAAAEKLAETMREMFVGSARRLIANLSLDECLTRRKETIAGFLLDEIAPVVGGSGAPEDTTTKGWGVVLDTIEIQQVRIQSQQVFAHLQAPYRAEIAARAELADLERTRQVTERRAETELEQRRTKAAADVAAMQAEQVRTQASHAASLVELDHHRAVEQQKQDAEHARARKQADLAVEIRRRDAEARDKENELELAHQKRAGELERELAQVRTSRELVAALPAIAKALHTDFNNVTVVGGESPLNAVPAALAQVLALAKSFGIDLPKRGE
jgi:regulator of protease activity HflC (stomatin/prohibitin superfamily)